MTKQTIFMTLAALIIGLIIGLGLGSVLFNKPQETTPEEKKIAYWVAPMDASYRRDIPGKSPMGMDLIPIYEENSAMSGMEEPGFTISANVQANLGLKTALVKKEEFISLIEATGRLTYDENKIFRLQVRTEGWIEKLYVKTVGENVKKGDKLFTLYSPDIATALSEYADARGGKSTAYKKLSKGRLMALGLSERTISQALKSGNLSRAIIFYAPQDGVVTSLGVREGSIVAKNTIAFEITDPTNLWLIADVFETDSADLNQGAHAQIIGQTGDIYHGMIDHIYPDLDPVSRTVQVRLNLPNPDGKLKPGQFFTVNIHEDSQLSLIIPRSAVIRLGTGNHVIVAHEKGRFEAAEVEIGKSSGERIQILRGLREGEKVVTSGQFLLDSESSFTGAKLRILDQSSPQIKNDSHKSHKMQDDMGDMNHDMDGMNHDTGDMNHDMGDMNHDMDGMNHDMGDMQ